MGSDVVGEAVNEIALVSCDIDFVEASPTYWHRNLYLLAKRIQNETVEHSNSLQKVQQPPAAAYLFAVKVFRNSIEIRCAIHFRPFVAVTSLVNSFDALCSKAL